jgi:hypothetical protein
VAFSRLEHLRLEVRAVSMVEKEEAVTLDAALKRKTVRAWFALPFAIFRRIIPLILTLRTILPSFPVGVEASAGSVGSCIMLK